MKPLIVVLVTTICAGVVNASPETRERYAANTSELYSRLEAVYSGAQSSPQEVAILLQRIGNAWQSLPSEDKQFLANRRWNDYRMAATRFANFSDYEQAADALQKQVAFCREFSMSPAGNDDVHFANFVLVQARVASVIGRDPLSGMTNYLFRKQGDKYIVAREELDPEVKGITVAGVTESEALAQVLEVSAQDGRAMIEKTRWVVGPKGRVEETIRRATREVFFDEAGRLSVKPISAPILGNRESQAPQPSATPRKATPAPTIPVPTAMPVPSTPAPIVAASPAPIIERKSPVWLWVVGIVALIVIVAFAAKRRG